MAGQTKRKTKKTEDKDWDRAAIYRYLAWGFGAGVWALLTAALVSYHPADAPGYAVVPRHEIIHNWIGSFGAIVSHHVYLMLGPGVWVGMSAGLTVLILIACRRAVTQPVLRVIGVMMMVIATSGMLALWFPNLGQRPEGAGGLLAIFVNHELLVRFNLMGCMLILLVMFWVGAILAADQWVVVLPKKVGYWLLSLRGVVRPSLAMAGGIASIWGDRMGRRGSGKTKQKAKTSRSRGKHESVMIDEDAGGLGATEAFDPDVEMVSEGEYEEEEEEEDEEYEYEDEEENKDGLDAPGAYIAEKKGFTQAELRDKIKQLPINFATRSKVSQMPGPEVDLSGYKFPTADLLEDPESDFTEAQRSLVQEQGVNLESALQQYKIDGEVVGIDSGPVITLFEVRLAPGTKVSRINAIESDLARAMKAQNIRVVPNTAGRDTVGVEVPNLKKEKVRLKELMLANQDAWKKMKLPMWLGKDASGEALIGDLNAMPHMLIAGTTGSGKSVCMNSIIMSFLFTKRPDELKLVLVDPKMVEMSMFKNIPHLMCPVVTEMGKAASILEWAVTKMDERYELLAETGVRDIAGYNSLGWEELKERMSPANESEEARIPKKLPYMVFVIDELADLMMTNKEVEAHIVRIAQKARAVGMHLILATQRPQANVVTGLIKSNMPCRVAFKVASGMDSRIVLDQKGGELLLGQGDMLYLSPGSSKLTRAQGTLVDDQEIRRTTKFLKEVAGPSFEPQLVQIRSADDMDVDDESAKDPLFDQAVRVVLQSKRGSVSLLQRRLTIGYSRSARLIEAMSAAGILGSHKGAKAREVTMTAEEYEAIVTQAQADANSGMVGFDEAEKKVDDSKASVPEEYEGEHQQ